jgi:hypothetical protein
MITSAIKKIYLLLFFFLIISNKNIIAQTTNLANVTIVAGATNTGGSFTGTAPNRVWTPTATTSSIGVSNLVAELNSNDVTISTAFAGGTGAGNVTFNAAVTTAGTSTAARTFTINTTGTITVSNAITLTRTTPTVAGTLGYPGVNVNFTGAVITVSAAISANGGNGRVGLTTGNAASRSGTDAGNAGNITLTTSTGALTISAALSANGGNGGGGDNGNPSGNGGNGGTITLNSGSATSVLSASISNTGGTGGVGTGGSPTGTTGTTGSLAGSGPISIGAATNLSYAPSSVAYTGVVTKIGAGSLTFGNVAVSLGGLTINEGTYTASSGNTTLTGNFSNNATFATGNGTLVFGGSTLQTIGGSVATTFNNVSITNAAGVKAENDMTVNGVLNLAATDPLNVGLLNMIKSVGTYGSFKYSTLDGDSILPIALYNTPTGYNNSTNSFNDLNSFVLNLGASATVTGQGDVTGKIRRTSFVSGTTYAFGAANMTMSFTSVSGSALPTQMTIVTSLGDSAGLHADKTNAVKRTYQVLRTGGAAATLVTLRLPYNQSELNGNTDEDNLVLWDHHLPYAGVTPHEHGKTGNNSGNNWIELAGHSLFYFAREGDTAFTKYWMIGTRETFIPTWLGAAGGAAAGDWNNPSNWTSGSVPPADSAVIIPDKDKAPNAPALPSTVSMRALEIQSNTTFNAGNSTITITGGPAINGGRGSWINSGEFEPGTSTIIFTHPAATLSGNTKFHKLTIANGSTTSVGNSTKIEVENTLVVNGSLNTNNSLVLKSYSTGTANIGNSSGSISGTVTVERHISANRKFRLLAHPFSTVQNLSIIGDSIDLTGNVDGITSNTAKTVGAGFVPTATNNPNAFWFNTATADGNTVDGGWRAFTAADGSGTNNTWGVGQGIRVLVRGRKGQGLDANAYTPDTVVFNTTGTVNTGNVNITLNTGGTGNSSGFNLVGNPYPSPVDISAVVFASASEASIQKTIYLRNPVTGGWISQLLVNGVPFVMPAYTAAFIRNVGATSVTLPFTEARKADASTVTTFKNGSLSNTIMISLKLGDMVFDNLNLQFNDNANAGFEQGLDATKFGNDSFNFNAITSNNVHVCTDMRPAVPGTIIPLFTNIRKGSTKVTFSVDEFAMDKNLMVYLNDQKLSKKVILEKGMQYEFDINASDNTTFGSTRFFISLEDEANGVEEQILQGQAYTLYPNPAQDYLNIGKQNIYATAVHTLELMDMNGKILQTSEVDFASNAVASLDISHLQKGVYFVKLSGRGFNQTLRFVK